MDFKYALLIIIINILSATEGQLITEKNFDILINISKLHFYPNRETYVIDNSRVRPYVYFKELCKVFSESWPAVLIGDDEEIFEEPAQREINILFVELNKNIYKKYKFSPTNKNIFYIDLREDSACSGERYLEDMPKNFFWKMFFQSIILFHYQNNCSNEYEMWTREPWSDNPGEKIENIQQAYFNRKPNLHGAVVELYSSVQEIANDKEDKISRFANFKNIWFEKWNMQPIGPNLTPSTSIFLSLEPVKIVYNADAYNIISMCFVVQKGKQRPKWESLIWNFHWKVWLCLPCVWFISGLVWFVIMRPISLFKSLCDVCSLMISYPITWLSKLNNNLARYFAGLFMLTSIVLITGFQSNLYKNMQVSRLYLPINEIKHIKDIDLSIICTFPFSCLMIFGIEHFIKGTTFSRDDLLSGMVDQLHIPRTNKTQINFKPNLALWDVYNDPDLAIVTPCESARSMINNIPTFSKNLHIVEETIASFPLYYKRFPFEDQLRRLLFIYTEAGIAQWVDQMDELKQIMKILWKEQKPPLIRVFNIEDVQIAFIILFFGLLLSTFVFFCELITKYCSPHSNLKSK